jgi:hypothetical protein
MCSSVGPGVLLLCRHAILLQSKHARCSRTGIAAGIPSRAGGLTAIRSTQQPVVHGYSSGHHSNNAQTCASVLPYFSFSSPTHLAK